MNAYCVCARKRRFGLRRLNFLRLFSSVAVWMLLVLVVQMCAGGGVVYSQAPPLNLVSASVTHVEFTTTSGDPLTEIRIGQHFFVNIEWDASMYGASIHENDFFEISLPNEFRIFNAPGNIRFPVFMILPPPDLPVKIGEAVVTPGPGGNGGSVRVTFNNFVESHHDVKGTLSIRSTLNSTIVSEGQTIQVIFGKFPVTVQIGTNPPVNPDEVITKWASPSLTPEGHVRWTVRINYKKDPTFTNVTVKDTLEIESGGPCDVRYVPDSFRYRKGNFAPNGAFTPVGPEISIPEADLNFNAEKTSYQWHIGNIAGKSYRLSYRSTFCPNVGLKLKNRTEIAGTNHHVITYFAEVVGNGTGNGIPNKFIRIEKLDADTGNPIQGVKFKITYLGAVPPTATEHVTNSTGIINTGQQLVNGRYRIEEVDTPFGYAPLNPPVELTIAQGADCVMTPHPHPQVELEPGENCSLKIRNKRKGIDIEVEKRWFRSKLSEVRVQLFADGVQVRKATLNESNNWRTTFRGLPIFQSDGVTPIHYTVTETPIPGMVTTIRGNAADGFIITNIPNDTPLPNTGSPRKRIP